jgi:ferredoxin
VVSDIEERVIGGLVVRIDRLLCVGFGDCIEPVGDALVFDDEGIITFTPAADHLRREHLIAACQICPVDALTVHENGVLIAPVRP